MEKAVYVGALILTVTAYNVKTNKCEYLILLVKLVFSAWDLTVNAGQVRMDSRAPTLTDSHSTSTPPGQSSSHGYRLFFYLKEKE